MDNHEMIRIIPRLEFDTPNALQNALVKSDQIMGLLKPLRSGAQAIEATDTAAYAALGAIVAEVGRIRKNQIVPLWGPLLGVVDTVRDFLKLHRQQTESECETISDICRVKMKEYERNERNAAQQEQNRLNKRREEPVVVKPNLPSIPGYRKTVNYRVTVTDPKALIKELLRAYKRTDTKRVQFLGPFVCLDVKALESYARETKDVKKFNAAIPGAVCREE